MTDVDIETIVRLSRDLRNAAATMSEAEARFIVDAYYLIQEDRKRSANQIHAMKEEPHSLLTWFFSQNKMLESQLKAALGRYSDGKKVGRWMQSIVGIGPVISAGMLAHIDINECPTAGHIWRFAGFDPTVKWEPKTRRPWNAALKTLCWKTGQSFMKQSGNDNCLYGKLYRQRKGYEVTRNDRGDNAEIAAKILTERKFAKTTDAFKHLTSGHLPPAQIDARARRWAVKMFLSHLQNVWWWDAKGKLPPAPYSIGIKGHVDYIPPPNINEMFPDLALALRGKND